MEFAKYHIRFVDSLHFFLEPLKNLSKTYNIDTLKGFFPHHFNTPENQNYIGVLPSESQYGVSNMDKDTYDKEFKPWYDQQVANNKNDWNFREEMIKYCRADVELLSKAVLRFRHMFKERLDIDPFRYVTLASLCMAIFRGCFLPDKSIVANEQNKPISKVCNEWLIYLNDDKLIPEVPVFLDKSDLKYDEEDLHKGKLDGDTTIYYQQDKHTFTPDALCRKRKIIKEFNGCKWHGCPKCNPECKAKYNRTMERQNLLKLAGYNVEVIWECDWSKLKKTLPNKSEIEDKAQKQNIQTRHALCGGRTEAFKSHVKCNKHQKIFYLDVVSLYPTVNALDDYAVGFKKYVDITVDDIMSDKFIGLVKCDVKPPKDLQIPVLPDSTDGKLLFHLNDMYEKTWASVELKLALEKGYQITKIHSAVAYKRYNGLMREYVGNFIKMKIENSGVKTQKECDEVNEYHKRLGFNFVIKPENTVNNPGLRQVAKICLNSLWGKFGQRCGMDDYDFFFDYNTLIKHFVDNDKIVPQTWNIIDSGCVELRYTEHVDMIVPSDYISEITAVFTTANARVRLYKMMDWLDTSQVCYCDTDSVIFIYDETNPEHKNPYIHKAPDGLEFGKGLGQWEDEFDGKDYIIELVIAGAKSYSFKTAYGCTKKGKVVVKQKGITLDRANDNVVNFDTMRNMVLYDAMLEKDPQYEYVLDNRKNTKQVKVVARIESEKRFQFKWDTLSKDIITQYISKSIKSTVKEKRTIDGFNTLPFGFEHKIMN
jgi:G:T-mismatch repair DNA endonuclease (very short patch repair protein)